MDPKLKHSHPLFPPFAFYGAVLVALAALQFFSARALPPLSFLGWVILGWLLWSFLEYVFHRFVLHHEKTPRFLENCHEHRPHHQNPQAPDQIVYAISESVIFFIPLFGALWGITRDLRLALALQTGVLLGYLAYELAHWGSHFWPRSGLFGKLFFENHWQHHFKDPHRYFGFSTSFWDRLFGTHGQK